MLRHEPVETTEHELGTLVAEPTTTLESQKLRQVVRQWTFECGHLGTGSATVRKRRNATRT
jgi:hypothetical protein